MNADFQYGELCGILPPGWFEVDGDELPEDTPFTLGKGGDGVGALQISTAEFRSGRKPQPTQADLESLLKSQAEHLGLSLVGVVEARAGRHAMSWAGGLFRTGNHATRMWLISDGLNFAFVTYSCDWDVRDTEKGDIDAIVGSLEFLPPED